MTKLGFEPRAHVLYPNLFPVPLVLPGGGGSVHWCDGVLAQTCTEVQGRLCVSLVLRGT